MKNNGFSLIRTLLGKNLGSDQQGFSLIEVLIAIAVAAVILPGVVVLLSLGSFTSQQGETYTKAYAVAQGEMESVYSLKKSNWSGVVTNCPYTSDIFTVCKTVTNINTKEKKVVIEVSWNERGTTQKITNESLVADI